MHLSEKISKKISTDLNLDQDKSEVIAYGAYALMQILLALGLVALFGLLLGVLLHALVASFTSSILRQYSGGVHASKSTLCLILGTAVTILIALLAKFLSQYISIALLLALGFILFTYSTLIVYKYAPVDSIAKPIKTDNKKKRMRKISFIIIAIYFVIFITFMALYYFTKNTIYIGISLSLIGALGWQAFTLTAIGHKVLTRTDVFLNQLLFKKGETHNE